MFRRSLPALFHRRHAEGNIGDVGCEVNEPKKTWRYGVARDPIPLPSSFKGTARPSRRVAKYAARYYCQTIVS